MNSIVKLVDTLGKLIRMRYFAILAVTVMFVVLVAAHIVIDKRSAEVFREELKTHARHTTNLIFERISSHLANDLHSVETFSYQAALLASKSSDVLSSFAISYKSKTPHLVAVGTLGERQLQYKRPESINYSSELIDALITRSEKSLIDADGRGVKAGANVISLGKDHLLIYHRLTPILQPGSSIRDFTSYFIVSTQHTSGEVTNNIDLFGSEDSEDFVYAVRDAQNGLIIAGNKSADHPDAMIKPITVGNLEWEVLAYPLNGWDSPPSIHANFRLALFVAAIATLLPMLISALLLTERNGNIDALKLREAKLKDLTERFKLAIEASQIGLWEMNSDDGTIFMDHRAAEFHNQPAVDQYGTMHKWLNEVHVDDRPLIDVFLFNCICTDTTHQQVYRVVQPDGSIRYLRTAGSNYAAADGKIHTTGIIWDVTADMIMAENLRSAKEDTDLKNAELEKALNDLSLREHQLEELSGRLNLALESYNCGTWLIDPYNVTAIWDDRMYQLYDLDRIEDQPVDLEMFLNCLHPDDREAAVSTGTHAGTPTTHRVLTRSGETRYIRTVGQTYRDRNGRKRIVGIAFDITSDVQLAEMFKQAKDEAEAKNAELEQAKNRIEHNALHDPLTGLANRRKLDVELDRITAQSTENVQNFAILHLDLDRFKQINDTLGHAAGDAMLEHTSQILKQNIGPNNLVARIGGDEFVILVENFHHLDTIKSMASRIISELSQPLIYEGLPCRCGVSIGIAFGNGRNVDSRSILINADIALYRAKAQGRNRYEFFTKNLQAEIINTKRTADEILAGLENNEFEAWYQPQICARTQKLAGVEALVRWRHPKRGILTPAQFLKVAEELNVVSMLDRTVLRQGLAEKRLWELSGIEVPKLSVNVSARRLHDEDMLASLRELDIRSGEIAFELVESIFLDEVESQAISNIEAIKNFGVDIEIDDFGTGHTSIISLLKVKPKRLKIDRQLVTPITTSEQERKLVRSVIEIASSLGIETVAEGIETREHANILTKMGCDVLQGYLFSKPLPAEEFIRFAKQQEWRMAS